MLIKRLVLNMKNIFKITKKTNLNRGFTLIELLIYSGMLSILLGVFTTLFGAIIDAQLDSNATASVQQDGQYILAKLSNDISSAQSVSLPTALGDQTSSLTLSKNSTTYTYSLNGNGNLIITTGLVPNMLNGFNTAISNLQFTRRGNTGGKNSISFTYTVTGRTIRNAGPETAVYSSTASLR